MNLKAIILTAALIAAGASMPAAAQDAHTGATTSVTTPSDVYVAMDFDGLMFQVPQGMKVERGSRLTALYPDGTFGLIMETVNQPSTKGISKKLCERFADSAGLPRNLVKKHSFNGIKGAMAQGMVQGQTVTCIVLPIDKHQVMITVMGDPSRADWTRRFLDTLRR